MSDNSEDYIFADPLFVAITYFDIMVTEAFHQKEEWHMWLYYYDSITRLICENYEITEESDLSKEWPNDYSRLLYEMMSNMQDWLMAMEEMVNKEDYDLTKEKPGSDDPEADDRDADDEYADFIRLDSIDTDRGANIPKSTAICLFSCHRRIIVAANIPNYFKESLTEQLFITCGDLRKHDEGSLLWQYSELMLHCLEENLNDRRVGTTYHRVLQNVYEGQVRNEVIVSSHSGGGVAEELDDLIL